MGRVARSPQQCRQENVTKMPLDAAHDQTLLNKRKENDNEKGAIKKTTENQFSFVSNSNYTPTSETAPSTSTAYTFTTTYNSIDTVSTKMCEKEILNFKAVNSELTLHASKTNDQHLAAHLTSSHSQNSTHTYALPSTPAATAATLQRNPTSPLASSSQSNKAKKKNSNKRSRSSPEKQKQNSAKQTKLSHYWLGMPNSNQFELLGTDTEDEDVDSEKQRPEVVPKPPPIYITDVANIQPLRNLLTELAGDNYEIKIYSVDEVKVQPKSEEIYRIIAKALNERGTRFHTYQPKSEKNFNVVLRGMHFSTPVADIKAEIEQLGHEVVNISNIKQRTTKKPLPMFWVNLKQNVNNKDIYQVIYLLNTKISFEPPRKKREIPQCTRCQRYGHTKNGCNHNPRCVKCAGDHLTSNCSRTVRDEGVKCVLCNQNHPANYKGCGVYKQLQEKRFPALRRKKAPSENNGESTNSQRIPGQTYSDTVRIGEPQPNSRPSENTQLTSNTSENNSSNINANTCSADINELKEMMKTLMQQMSAMINLLTVFISK